MPNAGNNVSAVPKHMPTIQPNTIVAAVVRGVPTRTSATPVPAAAEMAPPIATRILASLGTCMAVTPLFNSANLDGYRWLSIDVDVMNVDVACNADLLFLGVTYWIFSSSPF